jgi:hypothetical protein
LLVPDDQLTVLTGDLVDVVVEADITTVSVDHVSAR